MVNTIKKLKEICKDSSLCDGCAGDELCNFMNGSPESIDIEMLDKAHKEFIARLG